MTTKNIKYWLEEKELKTPEHDEMVLWCFNNSFKILKEMELLPSISRSCSAQEEVKDNYGYGEPIYYHHWDWEYCNFIINEKEYLKTIKEKAKEVKEEEDEDSYCKKRSREELEDIQGRYNYCKKIKPKVIEDWKEFVSKFMALSHNETRYKFNKVLEFNLSQSNGWNIGFIDLLIQIEVIPFETKYFHEKEEEPTKIFLEIKPKINSIGEVMRQINFYRNYCPKDSIFILVTKTKGIREIFESQGVFVYEYKGGQQTLK